MKTLQEKIKFATSKTVEQFVKRYVFMAIRNAEETKSNDLYEAVTKLCEDHTNAVITDSFGEDIDQYGPTPQQQAEIDEMKNTFTISQDELIPLINYAASELVKEGKVTSYQKEDAIHFDIVAI